MSGISQEDLEKALEAGDIGRLEAVPGLGKKTAQKMVLALKGRIVTESAVPGVPAAHAELVEALVGMGFDRKSAGDAVARVEKEYSGDAEPAEREKLFFKQAIMLLSSGA